MKWKSAYLIITGAMLALGFGGTGLLYLLHIFGVVDLAWYHIWIPVWAVLVYLVLLPIAYIQLMWEIIGYANGKGPIMPSPIVILGVHLLLLSEYLNARQVYKNAEQ